MGFGATVAQDPWAVSSGGGREQECLRCGKHWTSNGAKNHCSKHLSCALLVLHMECPHRTPQQPICFCTHFTDEETEAQRGQTTYPQPHSLQIAKLGFEYKQPDA